MANRRVLRWVLSGVVVLVVALGAVVAIVATAFVGLKPAEDRAELPGGAQLVKDGFANVFLLSTGPGKVALIDCGMDPEAKAVTAALKERDLSTDAVEAVFITHGHSDHIGGCKAFKQARLHALSPEVGLIEGSATVRSPMTAILRQGPSPTGLKVVRPMNDGDVVTIGTLSVRALALPGHTPGSSAYLAREVLYLGDAAGVASNGRIRNTPWVFSTDTAQAEASLKALSRRLQSEGATVQMVAPAHSGTAMGPVLTAFAAQP